MKPPQEGARAIRSRLVALDAGVGLEGVLLRADEVAGAEERHQQLGGRDERLERRILR